MDQVRQPKSARLDFSNLEVGPAAEPTPSEGVWSLVRRTTSGGSEHRALITADRTHIGRRPENKLCIPHPTISGQHAELFRAGNDLFVRDLQSTNGTLLNGRRITSAEILQDGDVLHFGQVLLVVERLVRESRSNPGQFAAQTFVAAAPEDAVIHEGFDRLINVPAVEPWFQPIVTLGSGEFIGYEVLVRSHLRGLETPDKMFRVAAMRSAEARLSEVCRTEGMQNAVQLDPSKPYFLNTHPVELGTGQLLRSLEHLRERYPHMPIVLEIHEGAVTSVQYLSCLVSHLHDLDIGLAYDDFGAGQARLVELFEVPPDILKFDLKFIRGLETAGEKRRSSVRSLLRVVRDLNVKALAEGVETVAQAEVCMDLGFELAQGYYFGKPAPRDFWETTTDVLNSETQSLGEVPPGLN